MDKVYSDAHCDLAKLLHHLHKGKFAYCGKKAPFYYYNGTYWGECDPSIILRNNLIHAVELYETLQKERVTSLHAILNKKWKSKSYSTLMNSHDKLKQDYEDDEVLKISKLASQLQAISN